MSFLRRYVVALGMLLGRQAKVAAIETATIVQAEEGKNQALGDTTARTD